MKSLVFFLKFKDKALCCKLEEGMPGVVGRKAVAAVRGAGRVVPWGQGAGTAELEVEGEHSRSQVEVAAAGKWELKEEGRERERERRMLIL